VARSVDGQVGVSSLMDQRLANIVSTQNALLLMEQFNCLGISELAVADKYQCIVAHYSCELDTVARMYQTNKTDPPIGRDLPPISGTSYWHQVF